MSRARPERGERRIDAATDYLAQYGFAKPQIHKVITDLLEMYGRDGWVFLEEGSYRIVREQLVEQQAQQDQKQEAAAAEEASPPQKVPQAKGPCYGWISEASETESEPEDEEMLSDAGPVIFTKKDIQNPVETLPSKRN